VSLVPLQYTFSCEQMEILQISSECIEGSHVKEVQERDCESGTTPIHIFLRANGDLFWVYRGLFT